MQAIWYKTDNDRQTTRQTDRQTDRQNRIKNLKIKRVYFQDMHM